MVIGALHAYKLSLGLCLMVYIPPCILLQPLQNILTWILSLVYTRLKGVLILS